MQMRVFIGLYVSGGGVVRKLVASFLREFIDKPELVNFTRRLLQQSVFPHAHNGELL